MNNYFEHSFGRVPDQTTVANAMAEHGNVRPSTGWKGIVHRLLNAHIATADKRPAR